MSKKEKKCDFKIELDLGKVRKYFGKRRKCWLAAFSPFPTMFSKGLPTRCVNSRRKALTFVFLFSVVTVYYALPNIEDPYEEGN